MGCLIVYYLGFNRRRWSQLWKRFMEVLEV